jgi:hypothetical protein
MAARIIAQDAVALAEQVELRLPHHRLGADRVRQNDPRRPFRLAIDIAGELETTYVDGDGLCHGLTFLEISRLSANVSSAHGKIMRRNNPMGPGICAKIIILTVRH